MLKFKIAFPVAAFGISLFCLLTFFPLSAGADNCYIDCMRLAGCWDSRSDENVSFCSGTGARCSTDCRNTGDQGGGETKKGKSYGAIAYSKKDGAYGYSHSWKSRKKAEQVALKNCREHGARCKIAVWFYNQCGAVAADGKKTGVGLGSSTAAASADALKDCGKFSKKNCAVQVSHCSF